MSSLRLSFSFDRASKTKTVKNTNRFLNVAVQRFASQTSFCFVPGSENPPEMTQSPDRVPGILGTLLQFYVARSRPRTIRFERFVKDRTRIVPRPLSFGEALETWRCPACLRINDKDTAIKMITDTTQQGVVSPC